MKTVAIIQSNYIPWKGYFDIINMVDEFLLYDEAQYTKGDWRNRNQIKTPEGLKWLTIPVVKKGKFGQEICDVRIGDPDWARIHFETISQFYAKSRYFPQYNGFIRSLYFDRAEDFLGQINYWFIRTVMDLLGIATRVTWSTDYGRSSAGRTERLVELCKAAEATNYLSGPAAGAYLDEGLFDQAGIKLQFMDYSGYPEYEQLHPPFMHHVSIIDLLLNCGPEAAYYIWGWRDAA